MTLISKSMNGLGIVDDGCAPRRIITYLETLNEWNQKFNLTSIDPADQIEKIVVESAAIQKFFPADHPANYILDLGSGAGIPGIILAILNPLLKVGLVESKTKKCKFLHCVKEKLGLENLDIYNVRIEKILQYAPCLRRNCDIITARALGKISLIAVYSEHLMSKDGRCILPRGESAREELVCFLDRSVSWDGKAERIQLPCEFGFRNFIVIWCREERQ